MRKVATIVLMAVLLLNQTPAGQLLKLRLLIEHYSQHKALDGLTVAEFLKYHYSGDHKDSDSSQDMQLPFKTIHQVNGISALVNVPADPIFSTGPEISKKITPQISVAARKPLCSVFHPPRG